MVAEGNFREDLFYRINVIPIRLPALRKRIEDIPLLAEHFVGRFAQQMGKSITGISGAAMACLQSYNWPGNIRELENAIERAVALERTPSILVDSLPEQYKTAFRYAGKIAAAEMTWSIMDAYSKAWLALRQNKKVEFIKTPDSVLKAQLESWDKVIAQKSAENSFFGKVLDSQKEYMKRVVGYQIRFEVPPDLAYEHFFGKA